MTVQACPPSTPYTPGVVVFSPTEFVASYPAFTGIANPMMQSAFDIATLMLNNTCGSRVKDANRRQSLLYLLTAHVTFLTAGSNDGAGNVTPAPGVVGRIDKATEGSVSVSAVMDTGAVYGKDWYVQTQWGAMYWEATAWARRGRYIAPPAVCADFNGGIGGPFFTGGGGCNGC